MKWEFFNNNYSLAMLRRNCSPSVKGLQPLLSPAHPFYGIKRVWSRRVVATGFNCAKNIYRGFSSLSSGSIKFSSSTAASLSSQLICNETNIPLDIIEWLRGFTDGEGNFYIRRRSAETRAFSFKYSFGLHVDDKETLIFIQKTLGIGKVSISGKVAYFEVYDLKNIAKIIEIFTIHPLNSTKQLNFLDFKRAYELYMSLRSLSGQEGSLNKKEEIVQEIAKLKEGMNNKRINYQIPELYKPRITPYWLLGFVEGEGSFNVVKGYGITFSMSQSSLDSALMLAIKDYLNNLSGAIEHMRKGQDSAVYLGTYIGTANNEITRISISQTEYIRSVLIRFFEGLVWRSKKYLDFQDWVNILKLRDRCHHYEEKGDNIMSLIVSQMNNKRLSTKGGSKVDRMSLQKSLNELLSGPSNCEIREGKIWIKSLNRFQHKGGLIKPMAVQFQDQNGNIIKTFSTQADCAKSLGVTRTTVARWLQEGKPVLYENKIVYIAKLEVIEE